MNYIKSDLPIALLVGGGSHVVRMLTERTKP